MAIDPTYQIIPYQASWKSDFDSLASDLRCQLDALAVRIDHIGSTSVPSLASKDIIDIQISVHSLVDSCVRRQESMGYIQSIDIVSDHRPAGSDGPDSDWQKFFFHSPDWMRHTHIHVRVIDRPNQVYPLLFRDYLRTHPNMAQAYAELKRRLSINLEIPSTYPEVKDPAVDLIYFAATDWAALVNWSPGPSDA